MFSVQCSMFDVRCSIFPVHGKKSWSPFPIENPKGIPPQSPALRMEAGRYAGKNRPQTFPNRNAVAPHDFPPLTSPQPHFPLGLANDAHVKLPPEKKKGTLSGAL